MLPSHSAVEISFEQTTYTAYASEGTPLKVKVLKTGHIRQNIVVDVTFSNGQTTQTISFDPLQNMLIEVSFDPGSKTATYSLSLALAEPSQKLEGLVVLGAPAEVRVMAFTPEGSRIVMVMEELLEEKYDNLQEELQEKYNEFQGEYDDLQRKYEALQKAIGTTLTNV